MTSESAAGPPETPAPEHAAGFWGAIKEALGGTQRDFTEGSLPRAITVLAIPMVLEMLMESLFAVVDVFFVARLGHDAVAAVGLTESVLTVIYALAVGLAMPAAAMVARRVGEKDPDGASRAAVQGIGLALAVSIVLGGLGAFFAPALLRVMGASDEILEIGLGYATLTFAANGIIFLLFLNNAIFRGAGDAAIAMRVLWIANGINIVLDPCLIFGLGPFPELGLTGAAVATLTGRGVGVLLQLFLLFGGTRRIAIARRHLKLEPEVLWRLLRLSVGGIGQNLIATASWIGLVRIVSDFGSAAVASYTIAIRVIIFALLPSWGLANAAATLVGQSLGARKPQRAEQAVWIAGTYNMLFLGSVALLFVFLAGPIVAVFTTDPAVLPIATEGLKIISYGYVFYAWGMVMIQAFNGAGDTTTPTLVNFICFWLCQIPLAWWLAHKAGMGPLGAFWAVAISYSLEAVIGVLLFRRGTWKSKVV